MVDRRFRDDWEPAPGPELRLSKHDYAPIREDANEDSGAAGICNRWRAWEAGTISEFLNWFLFSPSGTTCSEGESVVLEDWIYFRDWSMELDKMAVGVLRRRLIQIRTSPAIRVVIGGFIAESASVAEEMRVGLGRVRSIRIFLIAHGIDPSRIGIALRGSCWSVAEGCGRAQGFTYDSSVCRFQLADSSWTLARN